MRPVEPLGYMYYGDLPRSAEAQQDVGSNRSPTLTRAARLESTTTTRVAQERRDVRGAERSYAAAVGFSSRHGARVGREYMYTHTSGAVNFMTFVRGKRLLAHWNRAAESFPTMYRSRGCLRFT